MLETELNNTEPSGEERGGARSPEIDTGEAGGPPPGGQAGDDQAPAAKGRRRTARRPARAKASGTDAAPPEASSTGPDVRHPFRKPGVRGTGGRRARHRGRSRPGRDVPAAPGNLPAASRGRNRE